MHHVKSGAVLSSQHSYYYSNKVYCIFTFDSCITADQCPVKPQAVTNLAVQNISENRVIVAFDRTETANSYDIILNSTDSSSGGIVFSLNATLNMSRILFELTKLSPGNLLISPIKVRV